MNCCFSDVLFLDKGEEVTEDWNENNGNNEDNNIVYDEFYVKDSTNETFYYYRINSLAFFILFDKEKTFDDINSVKITLKALKDNFDNKENYKDLTDGNK